MLKYSKEVAQYVPIDYDAHTVYMTAVLANGLVIQQVHTCERAQAARIMRQTIVKGGDKDLYGECYATVNGKTHIYEIYN